MKSMSLATAVAALLFAVLFYTQIGVLVVGGVFLVVVAWVGLLKWKQRRPSNRDAQRHEDEQS